MCATRVFGFPIVITETVTMTIKYTDIMIKWLQGYDYDLRMVLCQFIPL